MAVKKFSLEAVIDLTDKVTAPINKIESKMTGFSKKMQKNFGGVGQNVKSIDAGINKAAMGLGVAAVAGGAAAFAIGKSFIDAGAEVEKYKTTLATMLGSQDAANARFEEMSKFAASTPFELNEVVALGNQLQALGQYSTQNMTLLGDLAAAAGKPIDHVTNAFAKLVSGQKGEAVNMFRDLLISNQDWVDATGVGVKKTGELMATTEQMMAALPKILAKKGFSGMMDNLSKSYEGMSSNFADTITRFKQGIGTMLLPSAKNLMGVLTKKMMEFTDVTNVKGKKALAAFSKLIDDTAKAIENFDLAKAIDNAGKFAESIVFVAKVIKELLPIILIVVAEIKLVTLAMSVFAAVTAIVGAASLPITALILGIMAAVALLTFGIYEMVKHWDAVSIAMQKAGVFMVTMGQIILKFLLMPLNATIDALSGILGLMSKIPGVGNIFGEAQKGLDNFQKSMNSLTGTQNKYSLGNDVAAAGFARMDAIGRPVTSNSGVGDAYRYANPSTRTAQSGTTTTTRNQVDLFAPQGWGMQPRGGTGAPVPMLNYGGAQ